MGKSCRKALLGGALLCWLFPSLLSASGEGLPFPEVVLQPTDRILILAPHPDDEVLGCAGIIRKSIRMGLPLRVVFLTSGDKNELSFILYRKHPVLVPKSVLGMGELRHAEALAAAQVLGVPLGRLVFLGYPDGGILPIWYQHWGNQAPDRSMLTRVTAVPYPDAFRPGAPYKGEEILRDIESIVREFRPTKVFVSHPADSHPDHRAWYLFVRVALWDLESEILPELYPYLVHYKNWPAPSRDPTGDVLRPPNPLTQVFWKVYPLPPEEVEKKQKALQAHKSQYESGPRSLASLVRLNELFGDFEGVPLYPQMPSVDLSQAHSEPAQKELEELTEEEQTAFVGLEWRYAQREGEDLVLSFAFSRPLAREVAVSVYVFGYRDDHPFERMPKLHLKIGVLHHAVYDQDNVLPPQAVRVSREANQIVLRIPLEVLGNPHRILTSAQTYLADVALDWTSWRVLELDDAVQSPSFRPR